MASAERKFAHRKIIQSPDGSFDLAYVDAKSGQPVIDLSQYTVVDAAASPFGESADAAFESTMEMGQGGFAAPPPSEEVAQPVKKRLKNGDDNTMDTSSLEARSAANNYGYVNTPGYVDAALGAAGFMAGPVGAIASQATRAALTHNNQTAVNSARQAMGLEEKGIAKSVTKAAVTGARDNKKGEVADVSIGGNEYSVGLEALDAAGRTTLTPEEARERGLTNPTGMRELSAKEAKAADKVNGQKTPGVLGKLTEAAKSLVTNPFSGVTSVPKAEAIAPALGVSATKDAKTNTYTVSAAPTTGVEKTSLNPVGTEVRTGDLNPRAMANVSLNMGPNRPNAPTSDIVGNIQNTVTDVLGADYSISVTSGMEDAGEQYGSDRHKTGLAADVQITDPQGNALSASDPRTKDVAQAFAAQYEGNIGFGTGYMGGTAMHLDTVPEEDLSPGQAQQWGTEAKAMAGTLEEARNTGLMPASYYDKMTANPPTPQARPGPAPATRPEMVASTTNNAKTGLTSPNLLDDTPPNARSFSPQTKSLMGVTLAGEIDLRETDLTTEEGRMEAFGIMSTMENRATRFGSVEAAITADKQYSTWNTPQAARTANANYKRNPELYDALVNEFAADPSKNLGFTSYYNPTIASPTWGSKMADALDIGAHRFGTLPEYSPPTTATGFANMTDYTGGLSQAVDEAAGNSINASVGGSWASDFGRSSAFSDPTASSFSDLSGRNSINATAESSWASSAGQSIASTAPSFSDKTESTQTSTSTQSGTDSRSGSSGRSDGSSGASMSSGPSGGGFSSPSTSGSTSSGRSSSGNGMTGTSGNAGKSEDNEA